MEASHKAENKIKSSPRNFHPWAFFFLFMITTKDQVFKYCEEHNMPMPSGKDLATIGHEIRNGFSGQHLKDQEGLIPGTGLIKITEYEKPMVVQGYPDSFLPSMIFHIERFYVGKKDRMDKAEAERVAAAAKKEKPPRPRVPSKRPAYSGK